MYYNVKAPPRLHTTITLPPSKSISNRALIINALAKGKDCPCNLSDCDDTEVIVRALRNHPEIIDIKAAGTAMRFLTAYLSTKEGKHILTGTERMRHRPIKVLVDALRFLGADIEYEGEEGFPPLCIRGKELHGGALEIPGNISSQYISALIMLGPTLENGLQLRLLGEIISRPYIDLTLHVMHEYGVKAEWSDVDTISIPHQSYTHRPYTIENDWSASSYWYEMVALTDDTDAQITMPGLLDASRQGDAAVKYIFSLLGVRTIFIGKDGQQPSTIQISHYRRPLPRLEYDFVNQPDLAPTLIAMCPVLGIPFRFEGLATLKIKETNRVEAMKTEMRKLGYVLHDVNGSEMIWDGERVEPQPQPVIDTYGDHRMAMAFAPLAIRLGEIRINYPEVVTKSYPRYWDDLRQAGFSIKPIHTKE